MQTEPLIQQLHALHLKCMANALQEQRASPDLTDRSFEDRLDLMIHQEIIERSCYRLVQRLRWAKLPTPACVQDLDTRAPRGLDPAQLAQVIDPGWIREHFDVLIIGPTGVGKSYRAAALAHAACRADFVVSCFCVPRLVEELARYGAMQKRSALFRQLAKADLLVLDDFGFAPLADDSLRDLREILDDRYDRRSTLITSQLPSDQWHTTLGDRTVADAILDRLVHNSYRLVLKGESMRRHRSVSTRPMPPSHSKAR